MRHINMRAWVIALIVALAPSLASAVGLGRLNMLSALGDPLNAEIDLVSVTKEELSSLTARLAAPDAYRRANLQYNAALVGARVSIERRPGGQSYVKITSGRPVNEPFIDLLVEITSSSGRLVREYTALVDPPDAGPPPSTATVPTARPAPAPEPPLAAATPAPAASRPPAPVAPIAGAKEYGPVQRGENLSKIAKSVMPEGVTLEQMLVGLYRSNPDAFIRKNLNLVKAGRILRVPDKAEIAAIAPADARKEFRAQVADWNSYRQNLASSASPAQAEGRSTVGGRITTQIEDKAGGAPKDVVRLSRGEPPGAAGKGKPRSTAERVRALEEEVLAREKALTDANERIAQLEKTIKDMQKLAELKSPGMAAAQQQAQQAAKAKAEAKPEPKPEPAKPEPAKPEPPKPEAAKAEPPKPEAAIPAPGVPDMKAEAKADAKGEAPKPEAKAPEQPKPKPQVAPAPPPPAPDMMDQVMAAVTDPLYLAAGGGVILLGGLAFWLARRRRSGRETDEPRRAAPVLNKTFAGAAAATAAADAAAAPVPAAAVDEVDPLAEAEVYIAYGRDAQAEEILKEALAKNPRREDAQLKLLEIYAARKDKSAFNKLASDFHKQTGGGSANWLAAAALGYALDPANPLYEAGRHAPAAPSAGTQPASDLDFEVGGDADVVATDITLDAGSTSMGHHTTTILDPGALQRMAAGAQQAPSSMPDFTLEIPAAGGDQPITQTDIALDPVPTSDSHMIDFQIELPQAGDAPAARPAPAAAPDTGAGLDFKLDIPDLNLGDQPQADAGIGGEKDGHWYDVQTKFDLAKAYQEMGDKDGAREILQEVIKEGDAEQRAQARKLLETLA